MIPNPPIRGHHLLYEGHARHGALLGGPRFGCQCGARADIWGSVKATKVWHRAHKQALRDGAPG